MATSEVALILLVIFFLIGLSRLKMRLAGMILFSLLIGLIVFFGIMGHRYSMPSVNVKVAKTLYSQPQYSNYEDAQYSGIASQLDEQADDNIFRQFGKSVVASALDPGMIKPFLIIFGSLLLSGLVAGIAMVFNRKTRLAGIGLLAAGPIVLILIAVGIPTIHTIGNSQVPATISADRISIPMPPGYKAVIPVISPEAPAIEPSQIRQETVLTPNSPKLIENYESVISDYTKALSQPLKLEIKDDIREKVSTLKINVQDLGQITVSGSSLVINSIGQAIAKAMAEKIRENNTSAEIAQTNSPKHNLAATVQAAMDPAHSAADNDPSKKAISADRPLAKAPPVEIAKSPKTVADESAASDKADLTENAKTPSELKRPAWVGKPSFLCRAGSKIPDYYPVDIIKSKSWGDAYLMNVSVGPYTSRMECDANAPDALSDALRQFAEAYYRRPTSHSIYRNISPEQLRQLVVKEWEEHILSHTLGRPMTQLHILVNFDQNAKVLIDNAMNSYHFSENAAVAGVIFGGVWLFLAYIWAYLKIDLATKGAYRNRLRFAFGSVILVVMLLALVVAMS